MSDSTPDLTEVSPTDTVSVVHVLHPEEHGTLRLQGEDLQILDPLAGLLGDESLALHLNPVMSVGPAFPGLTQAFLILGQSVHFLGWKVKEIEV